MAFDGLDKIITKMIANTKTTLCAQPVLFPILNSRLSGSLLELARTTDNDELLLLGFYLTMATNPAEAVAKINLREKIREALPGKLKEAGLTNPEISTVIESIDVLDLDVVDSDGRVDAREINSQMGRRLKEFIDEKRVSIAIGEIVAVTSQVMEGAIVEVSKEIVKLYDEIINNISLGLDSIRKVLESFLIRYHKKVIELRPGVRFSE